MPYSEMAYFDGYAFAHIAEWEEQERLARKARAARERFMRRSPRRH